MGQVVESCAKRKREEKARKIIKAAEVMNLKLRFNLI